MPHRLFATAFWSEFTQTWLRRDETRRAFKNVALSPQPPARAHLRTVWEGQWEHSKDGQWEIRPFVAEIAGSYHPGVDTSRGGRASGCRLAQEGLTSLEIARDTAQALARAGDAEHAEHAEPLDVPRHRSTMCAPR